MRENKHWFLLAACAVMALLGLFRSANAPTDGGYALGIGLFVIATLLAFHILQLHFDGTLDRRAIDIWPRRERNQWALVGCLAVVAVFALFVAATGDPALYSFGIALFLTCCVMAFLSMKAIFDAADRAPHHGAPAGQHAHTS